MDTVTPDGGDYVTPVPPRPPGGSARLRWLGVLAGFAVLVGVVVLQRHTGNAPAAADTPTPASSVTDPASPTRSPSSVSAPTTTPATAHTTTLGSTTSTYPITAPFTGYGGPPPTTATTPSTTGGLATTVATLTPEPASSGWEIDGFSSVQGLLRLDPTTGLVTRIPAPASGLLASPISFVSVSGWSLVAGYGNVGVTGILFPDGGPAVVADGELGNAIVALPGPDPSHLWIWDTHQADGPHPPVPTLVLVDWHGTRTATTIELPVYLATADPKPDGAGYALMAGIGGTYDVRPGSITLITHGTVLAAGPSGYLAYECGDTPACRAVVIDRATGSRRVLGPVPVSSGYFPTVGVIAPDGTHAAYADIDYPSAGATARLVIVDLTSGANHVATAPLSPDATQSGGFGFSPDGKQLAMVVDGGDVGLVDVGTGHVRPLGLTSAAGYFLNALTVRKTG